MQNLSTTNFQHGLSKNLCITGMHRSGTSLMASWLEGCGLSIHDGNLVGSSTGNAKGHFEDRDFVRFHSEILLNMFPKSKGWIANPGYSIEFNLYQRKIARELVSKRDRKYPIWGWKDPRTTLFLFAWRDLLPDIVTLLIWRPCDIVVSSLLRRSRKSNKSEKIYKINILKAVRLWISYNYLLCSYKQNFPDQTVLVPLNYAINNDIYVFNQINHLIQDSLRYSPISQNIEKNILTRSSSIWIKWLCKLGKSQVVEKKLWELSDIYVD